MTGVLPYVDGYPAFKLIDCRRWTNFVSDASARSLADNGIP